MTGTQEQASMKTFLAAATASTSGWLVSLLPQIRDALQIIVLILAAIAWVILIALRVRKWLRNKHGAED